jgi:hypothetical protein
MSVPARLHGPLHLDRRALSGAAGHLAVAPSVAPHLQAVSRVRSLIGRGPVTVNPRPNRAAAAE